MSETNNLPVITLAGESILTIFVGASYVDAGASAVDSQGNALTTTCSGTVDTQTPGTYLITYSAADSGGNTATAVRTVNVILPESLWNIVLGSY